VTAEPWGDAVVDAVDPDAPAPPADFLTKVARYAQLRRQQGVREAQAGEVKEQADRLEAELLEAFSEHGVQRLSVGGTTVYLDRTLWAKREEGATKEDVLDGLVAAGHPEFVTRGFNSQTVSGWLREREKSGEQVIPSALEGVLTTSEVFKLKTRRS